MRVRVTIVRRAVDFVSGHDGRAEAKHAQYLPPSRSDRRDLFATSAFRLRLSVTVFGIFGIGTRTIKTKNVFTSTKNDGRVFRVIA